MPPGQKRIQMSVRLRPVIAAWIGKKVEEGVFKDATHAMEFAIQHLMASEAPDGSLILAVPGESLRQAATSGAGKSKTESTKRQ
jgi:Arc/MetJ-type ribon-helix-helix transcriptional regulator